MGKSKSKKYSGPLSVLKRERDLLNEEISSIEKRPKRIIDVAYERDESLHGFKVLRVDGNPKVDRSWTQLERIFCKTECGGCPHGDFLYRYTLGKNGNLKIVMVGEAFFSFEALEAAKQEARKHPGTRGELVSE